MTSTAQPPLVRHGTRAGLVEMLFDLPPGRRGGVFQQVVSFRPDPRVEQAFAVGELRAAFADYWESRFGGSVPIEKLRAVLNPPVPIGTVLKFSGLMIARDLPEIEAAVAELSTHLMERLRREFAPQQLSLIDIDQVRDLPMRATTTVGGTVASLADLVNLGRKYPTIYADPPWPYENEASRAAAVNHYPTMSLDAIRAEPVGNLADTNAHLHLWTTNAFLQEALILVAAWGFEFKSCLVWVKGEIGMGNYWRVSHEFLLLGVRGNLTFRDRSLASWIQADRTIHSRKPGVVRALIERVSPPPYLELYGREELPDSAWTVYGNQVERRFF
jgi:N6-adenosine-specific RNA methylase IME4